MGSARNQNPWAPYDSYKDCSQGICSIYCSKWCYIIGPPPPSLDFTEADDENHDSPTDLSPLIIAIIGIFASAFILATYYTVISKYRRQRGSDGAQDMNMDSSNPNLVSESRQGSNNGLDESLIKSIMVHKYKKGDKLVEGTDCSVCLSEFEENESLRLLPKCSHAFHVPCIDTWLKSHSSCPLCRSNIAAPAIALVPHQQLALPPVEENPQEEVNVSASEYQHRSNENILVVQDNSEEVVSQLESRLSSCEIEQDHGIQQQLRRSVSIADVLHLHDSEDDDEDLENQMGSAQFSMEIGSSKGVDQEQNFKSSNSPRSSGVFSLVKGPLVMKRSTSTGRLVSQGMERKRIL